VSHLSNLFGRAVRRLDRYTERRAARRYWRRMERARKRWMASDRYAQIKACGHRNLRHDATGLYDRWDGYVCLDCGIGVLRPRRQP
jgi:hypothetical protein